MDLLFLGAAGTVTGSKTLLSTGRSKVMVDCGLFQGRRELRQRNWSELPLDISTIDDIVLTHAHIDHSGYLPVLVRQGWRGQVHATPGTIAMCKILLPDSGRLQEEQARDANRRGWSKHAPAKPLYDEDDAKEALELFEPAEFGQAKRIAPDVTLRFRHAGHIVGAGMVELTANGRTFLFSGDVGRPNDPLLVDPDPPEPADYLIVESTYADRENDARFIDEKFAEVINRTVRRGGTLIIPSFAVGRTQLVLYYLDRLRRSGDIPANVPVYVDSPMAVDVSRLLCDQDDVHLTEGACRAVLAGAIYVRALDDHIRLRKRTEPSIIISASGMATGGRVLSHFEDRLGASKNTVAFVGYQSPGTRGGDMLNGAEAVRLYGQWIPVRAEVVNLGGLSAHADRSELFDWLRSFKKPPRRTFPNHGDPEALAAMKSFLEKDLKWKAHVPQWRERVVTD